MATNPEDSAVDVLTRKLTIVLRDDHAPGIVEFLASLPDRTEAAFIRGLVYQWMLENWTTEDREQRLMAVLNGPGGRMTIAHGMSARVLSPLRSRRARSVRPPLAALTPAAPHEAAQDVMPGRFASRHQVSGAEHTPPASGPATTAPTPTPAAVVAPPPAPVESPVISKPHPVPNTPPPQDPSVTPVTAPSSAELDLDPDALAALDNLSGMFG